MSLPVPKRTVSVTVNVPLPSVLRCTAFSEPGRPMATSRSPSPSTSPSAAHCVVPPGLSDSVANLPDPLLRCRILMALEARISRSPSPSTSPSDRECISSLLAPKFDVSVAVNVAFPSVFR